MDIIIRTNKHFRTTTMLNAAENLSQQMEYFTKIC